MSSETIGQGEPDLKALDEYQMSDESPEKAVAHGPERTRSGLSSPLGHQMVTNESALDRTSADSTLYVTLKCGDYQTILDSPTRQKMGVAEFEAWAPHRGAILFHEPIQ